MDSNYLSLNACKNIKNETLGQRMEYNLETGQHLQQKNIYHLKLCLKIKTLTEETSSLILLFTVIEPLNLKEFKN